MITAFEAALPPLYKRLRNDSRDIWAAYTHHPFVQDLANKTLLQKRFIAWMVQDYFYLIQYARAYALLVAKSDTVARMQSAATILNGLLNEEMALHRAQLQTAGINPDDAEESLETLAYGRYVIDRAQTGDALDLVVTLSPCLAGYGEIGLRLVNDTTLKNHPYREWIETYGGATYHGFVREGLAQLEELGHTHGADARYPALLKHFRQAVRLETTFWDAGCVIASR